MNNIINILKEEKSIPLDEFINAALYNKKFGYYMKKNPFGKKGDFVTSPIISNLFGEMIAVWCVAYWEHLKKPKKIIIVELGPGDGSLCNSLLNTFKKFKNFYNALEINLYEVSKNLIKIQKKTIKDSRVTWIKSIEEINRGPIIFVGNEFFDSLPIKQIYKKNNLFFEKYVTLANNKKKIKFLYKKAEKKLIRDIEKLNINFSNNIIEYPVEAIKYVEKISKKIEKFHGGLLTFDYGYIKNKNADTLQSVKNHKYLNVLTEPSNADITSHINFGLLKEILEKSNLNVKTVITQNEFLQKIGILERANMVSKKMNFSSKADLYYRLKRLLDHKEMGEIFKVLFAQKKGNEFSLGF